MLIILKLGRMFRAGECLSVIHFIAMLNNILIVKGTGKFFV